MYSESSYWQIPPLKISNLRRCWLRVFSNVSQRHEALAAKRGGAASGNRCKTGGRANETSETLRRLGDINKERD
jgi:hypothetical protein